MLFCMQIFEQKIEIHVTLDSGQDDTRKFGVEFGSTQILDVS